MWVTGDGTGPACSESGPWMPTRPSAPPVRWVTVDALRRFPAGEAVIVDVSDRAEFEAGHIPGSAWSLRADLPRLAATQAAPPVVVTGRDPLRAAFASTTIGAADGRRDVRVLSGGTRAWADAGLDLEPGAGPLVSAPVDRYRRPYEGLDVPPDAMQAYLDWEYGLVAQLQQDRTHRFRVLGSGTGRR